MLNSLVNFIISEYNYSISELFANLFFVFNKRVSCESEYFIQELFYSPEDQLVDKKIIDIYEFTVSSENLKPIIECIKKENQQNLLLDIDLDFFSTLNPLKNLFGKDLYKYLGEKYRCIFLPKMVMFKNNLIAHKNNFFFSPYNIAT